MALKAAPPPLCPQKGCLIPLPRLLQYLLLSHGAVNALHMEGTQCCHLNAMRMPCIYWDSGLREGDAGQDPSPTPCRISLLSAHHACDSGRSVTTYPDAKPACFNPHKLCMWVSASVSKWSLKKPESRQPVGYSQVLTLLKGVSRLEPLSASARVTQPLPSPFSSTTNTPCPKLPSPPP